MINTHANPPCERWLRNVDDKTSFYNFEGNNVFLQYGLVQVGITRTTDNDSGFEMTRLFANSQKHLENLLVEIGLTRVSIED